MGGRPPTGAAQRGGGAELRAAPLRAGGARSGALPGLQGVRGQWTGSWQAYGGGGGPTNVDFGLKGTTWQWGDYGLDQAGCPPGFHRAT